MGSPKLPWQLAEFGLMWRARRKKASDSWRQHEQVYIDFNAEQRSACVEWRRASADLVLLQFPQDVSQREHDGGVAGEEPQSLAANQLCLSQVAWELVQIECKRDVALEKPSKNSVSRH